MNRRDFIQSLSIVAPFILFGLDSCNSPVSTKELQKLNFPKIENTSELNESLNVFVKDIKYSGKETIDDLFAKVKLQIEQDFKEGKTHFVNGWLISRTEIVLSNISQNVP